MAKYEQTWSAVAPEKANTFYYLPQMFTKTQLLWSFLIISARLFKYTNYLIKNKRYKNVRSKNEFYGKIPLETTEKSLVVTIIKSI